MNGISVHGGQIVNWIHLKLQVAYTVSIPEIRPCWFLSVAAGLAVLVYTAAGATGPIEWFSGGRS